MTTTARRADRKRRPPPPVVKKPPSEDDIEAARSPAGGWTKAQLAEWGVPWPPPKGWKRQLIAADPKPPRRFTVRVVGLTFVDGGNAYPNNVQQLREAYNARVLVSVFSGDPYDDPEPAPLIVGWGPGKIEPLPIVLRRNPDNEHDANAVEVHSPAVGMLGHLPRDIAARVAPWLDAGHKLRVGVASVLVMPGSEDNPGVSLCVERIDPDEAA